MTLDALLPLPEAARKFGIAEANLRAPVENGKSVQENCLPEKLS
jgi:hypothetical protein